MVERAIIYDGGSVGRKRRSLKYGPAGAHSDEHRKRTATPNRNPNRKERMAYVIAEPCIGTKDNSCVEVCPVDCIHPTPDEPGYDAAEMLYIDPEECIDCDACVEACPVDACFAEDQLPDEWQKFTQINADYFANAK
jgi:NAD-dependent dihydropyrimidine dehydrogenase PreA subunit